MLIGLLKGIHTYSFVPHLNLKSFFRPRLQSSAMSSHSFKSDAWNWIDLHVSPAELRPDFTLMIGQTFAWFPISKNPTSAPDEQIAWVGVVPDPASIVDSGHGKAIAVRQTLSSTEFALLHYSSSSVSDSLKRKEELAMVNFLRSYFQLDYSLHELYNSWADGCPRMKTVLSCLPGVRVVQQDPYECLISFICSSNNNIKRITQMLMKMKESYGQFVGKLVFDDNSKMWRFDDNTISSPSVSSASASASAAASGAEGSIIASPMKSMLRSFHDLYSFPTPKALSETTEEALKALGTGYRAKFLHSASKIVVEKGNGWLYGLRGNKDRLAVQQELLILPGVGPKVADCVALFSLDQYNSVPVDTHVWDIVVRDYQPSLQQAKSLTPTVYEAVGDALRTRFNKAGWAHSVLFAGELPEFRRMLPQTMQDEMVEFANLKKDENKIKKDLKAEQKRAKAIGNIDVDVDVDVDVVETPQKAKKAKIVSGKSQGLARVVNAADIGIETESEDEDRNPKKVARISAASSSLSSSDSSINGKGKGKVKTESNSSAAIFKPFESVTGTWRSLLEPEISTPYFSELVSFLEGEMKTKSIFPPADEIFSAFSLCQFEDVKVCIIGQDPYHGVDQAHGLAFSVKHGIQVPPSLRNMFKELHNDMGITPPKHGHLVSWSRQGVMLLNPVLTVRKGEANSHQNRGWEQFTDAVIQAISDKNPGCVFLCWGGAAAKKCAQIDTSKHRILTSSHPSPLGAYKTSTPFIGSKCFSKCNQLLCEIGRETIDWKIK